MEILSNWVFWVILASIVFVLFLVWGMACNTSLLALSHLIS